MGCVGLGESQVPMALQTSLLDSVLRIPPAKNWPSPNILILRTPCVNVHPSSSSLPILSRKIFPKPLRASTPQKYVYPDPIPEFAEAVLHSLPVFCLQMFDFFGLSMVLFDAFFWCYNRRPRSSGSSFSRSYPRRRTRSEMTSMRL